MTGLCTCCGRALAAHRAEDGSWIGCVPLAPITVSWHGLLLILRTPRDVYRLAALARKAA
jgi:hypothetical protein